MCLICKLDLSPFHGRTDRQRLIEQAEHRVRLAEERVRIARERLELAENPFRHVPVFTDIIHGFIAGHAFIRIVTNRPDYEELAKLGICTIYAYSRAAPYLRRVVRGGTRKKRKGGANQLVMIDVRPSLLHKLEHDLGIRSKEIHFD